ncbi:MAG: LLM class flavin-dependent oxidoreductase [Actinomycetota bacterium]|nr:LLM class flavin-dependent oxidoreductase [Actinomycetota bacterium]
MDFGMCVTTKLSDVDECIEFERLGFDAIWVPDSQMIWGDCYAYLALAAERTENIRLGTGVSVAGTRIPPVTAHSNASITPSAPGRTFLGMGAGNSAHRFLDHKPLPIKKYGEELRVIRELLDGNEVEYTFRGKTAPTRLLMADLGYINLDERIPIMVSGFGPKSQALAGMYGDGLVTSLPPEPRAIARALETARRGAESIGRELPDPFPVVSLTNVVVLQPGEDVMSDRIVEENGPYVISSLHYVYDKIRQYGGEPPHHLQGMWDRYAALVEETPEPLRHLRIHDGHCTFLRDDEREFVTEELLRGTCVVGTPDEIATKIGELDGAGLDEIMMLPAPGTQVRVAQQFADQVLPLLAA